MQDPRDLDRVRAAADADEALKPSRLAAWQAAKKGALDLRRGDEIRARLAGELKDFAETTDPTPESNAGTAVGAYRLAAILNAWSAPQPIGPTPVGAQPTRAELLAQIEKLRQQLDALKALVEQLH